MDYCMDLKLSDVTSHLCSVFLSDLNYDLISFFSSVYWPMYFL